MHTITNCKKCGNDFMYNESDTYLFRDSEFIKEQLKGYPVQDDFWPSRRWNEDMTEYIDLTGEYDVICQDCDHAEKYCKDVLKHFEIVSYDDYKNCVKEMWANKEVNELEQIGFVVNDLEKSSPGVVMMRLLTEKEFNVRFKETEK